MGYEIIGVVASEERADSREIPEWFKHLGVKQHGLKVWRTFTEPEMRALVAAGTGKRGKQLRRYFASAPLAPRYYLCLRAKDGKYRRPFAMEETQWESMPWVS